MLSEQNIIGPQIKALRLSKEVSQAMLAARCELLGWDVSENGITKIERQIRCVTDRELLILAKALRVKLRDIFPQERRLF